jgi:hypothetical protein
MIVFTHNDFVLDLSAHKLDFIDQSDLFFDDLVTESSYPFTISKSLMPKEINLENNSTAMETGFEGWLFRDGDVPIEASLEIISIRDNVELVIEIGKSLISKFDTKLSELPLYSAPCPDMYVDANQKINDTMHPYNYPAIITKKFDSLVGFQGVVNRMSGGIFVQNQHQGTYPNIIPDNQNIMQPLPKLIHVLQKGFGNLGFELKGDILTDEEINCAYIDSAVDFINLADSQELDLSINGPEYQSTAVYKNPFNNIETTIGFYQKEILIDRPGEYRITGEIKLSSDENAYSLIELFLGQDYIYYKKTSNQQIQSSSGFYIVSINFVQKINPEDVGKKIRLRIEDKVSNDQKSNLSGNPIRLHDSNGTALDIVENPKQIKLSNYVPDITFLDLIKIIKKWKKFVFNPLVTSNSKEIWMNYVMNNIDKSSAINITKWQNSLPEISFNKNKSYLFSFSDQEVNKDFFFNQIYVDKNGERTTGFVKDDNTIAEELDFLPLPRSVKNNFATAFRIDDSTSKLRLVFYEGLTNGTNACVNKDISIASIYNTYHKDWLTMIISSEEYKMDFIATIEKTIDIKSESIVYAYGKHLIVKEANKSQINSTLNRVTLTCLALE